MLDEKALQELLGTVLEVDPATVGPATDMDTVESWDSLRHMMLVLALEEEFGVQIPDEDAGSITSYPLIKLVLGDLLSARA
ncbi:acyl carrier protein [Modestobacter sp. NPDC049651]|uniref:acyl carrier protein n=1 Tax=unclassified Modestobacter TaxID=2643866 RepID=UPI0033FEF738